MASSSRSGRWVPTMAIDRAAALEPLERASRDETAFLERFDANAYVRLTQAMNDHDVSRGRGQYADVLRSIPQPALVVSVSSDVLYPPAEQRQLAEHLPNARYEILDCPHGHDGFLIETETLGAMITRFRERCVERARPRAVSSGNE